MWRQATLGTLAVDDLADGTDVDGVALEDLDEGFFQCLGAEGFEQLQQARGVAAEILVALAEAA